MAKRNKKQQQQSDRWSLLDCEVRPVRKSDSWCQKKVPKGKALDEQAPFGYIVTIPYVPNQNTYLDNVNGPIVRCKKHCGKLLLQVIEKKDVPKYGVKSFTRSEKVGKRHRRKQKTCRILSVRNLNKLTNPEKSKW